MSNAAEHNIVTVVAVYPPMLQSLTKCSGTDAGGMASLASLSLCHWQSMRPHAELHQQLYPGDRDWILKVWHSFELTGAQKPCRICAQLGPLGGS